MSWRTGDIARIKCPRCGNEVLVPISVKQVDIVPGGVGDSKRIVRVWFDEQCNVEHVCSDPTPPVERFIKTGHLDDPIKD